MRFIDSWGSRDRRFRSHQIGHDDPTLWRVTLTSGAQIELWADGYATEPVADHWVFDVLVDASTDRQDWMGSTLSRVG